MHNALRANVAETASSHLAVHGDTESKVLVVQLFRGIIRNHLEKCKKIDGNQRELDLN